MDFYWKRIVKTDFIVCSFFEIDLQPVYFVPLQKKLALSGIRNAKMDKKADLTQ